MHSFFTRTAGLVLAFGLFISCSTLKSFKKNSSQHKPLTKQELENRVDQLTKEIAASPSHAENYYQKGLFLNQLADKEPDVSPKALLFEKMKNSLDQAQQYYQQAEDDSGNQKVDSLLKVSWSKEHNEGVKIIHQETFPDKKKLNHAAQYFHNATIILPDSSISYIMEAKVLYQNDDKVQARHTLEQASHNPNLKSAKVYEELGFLYMNSGSTRKAIAAYKHARELNQKDLNIVHGLVNAYIAADEHQKALKLLDVLIKNRPDNFLYKETKAQELYAIADGKLSAYSSSLDHNKRVPSSSLKDARSYVEKAEKMFHEADQINPQAPKLQELKAAFYQNIAHDYQKIMSHASYSQQIFLKKQIAYCLSSAISPLKKLIASENGHQYWGNLYRIYTDLGRQAEADHAKANMN